MKAFLIFLGLAGACVSVYHEPGLRVRFEFGFTPWKGSKYFIDIPRTIKAATEKGWQLTERPEGHRPTLVAFSPNAEDPTLCGLYDNETGMIGGLQYCFPEQEVTNPRDEWNTQGFSKLTTTTQGKSIDYQCTALFFDSDEYLKKPLEERLASRTTDKILHENRVFLTGFDGKLDEFSDKTSYLENSIWTKQACIPWMGQHWYYNMSSTTLCDAANRYPYFPLTDGSGMVGMGLIVVGKMPTKDGSHEWVERPSKEAVQLIVPHGPQCLYDLAENSGLLTIHTYFVNKPWTIGCNIFG